MDEKMPVFVNICAHSQRNLTEMQFAARGRIRMLLNTVVSLFAILTGILLLGAGEWALGTVMLLMAFLLIFTAFIQPILAVKQTIRRYAVMSGADSSDGPVGMLVTGRTEFFEDSLTSVNPMVDKALTLRWDQVRRLRKTKHLWLLELDARLYLLIDREGFTVGDPEKFESFVKEKLKK